MLTIEVTADSWSGRDESLADGVARFASVPEVRARGVVEAVLLLVL